MTRQLCLFDEEIEPAAASRTTLYWRKRIDRAARAAFEIGRRQRKPAPRPRLLGAAVAPMPPRFEPRWDEAGDRPPGSAITPCLKHVGDDVASVASFLPFRPARCNSARFQLS
jgi:hypothetical protein